MCNSDVKKEIKFPFELFVRTLSTQPDCYVVTIFDACREEMPLSFRNGSNAAENDADSGNLIMVLGCPPKGRVDAESTVIVEFFSQLKELASPQDGMIILPGDLLLWRPG